MSTGARMGHMASGCDTAAVGIVKEYDTIREYAPYAIKYLRRAGEETFDVTPKTATSLGDSLYQGVHSANELNVGDFVSMHVNSFDNPDAHGCEVLYYPGSVKGKALALAIVAELAALGFYNRGAKEDTRGLYELGNTNMPAVIVEPFFCTNQGDVDLYHRIGAQTLGEAVAKGILKWKGIALPVNQTVVVPPPAETQQQAYDFKTLQGLIGAVQDNIPGPETLSKCPLTQIWAVGEVVKWIQNRLNFLGFNCGAADGVFGNMTLAAVKAFQTRFGLLPDGIIGQNTWRKLLGL